MRAFQEVNHMSEIDSSEMLLNFMIHEYLWKFCAVDVTHVRSFGAELA